MRSERRQKGEESHSHRINQKKGAFEQMTLLPFKDRGVFFYKKICNTGVIGTQISPVLLPYLYHQGDL